MSNGELGTGFSSLWRDIRKRNLMLQVLVLLALVVFGYVAIKQAATSLQDKNIASGFSFLFSEAAFEIGESLIEYSAESKFYEAFTVGLLNTLMVALIGNLLAVIWGLLVGISRLSPNWLLSSLARVYVDVLRNIPLLLQLFFWYALITEFFPAVRQASNPLPHVYISQRGFVFPVPEYSPVHLFMLAVFVLSVIALFFVHRWQKKRQQETGKLFPIFRIGLAVLAVPMLLTWLIGGAPTALDVPMLGGFNFSGGVNLSPEFVALLLGLVLYTGAFNAEIVRAGIEAVKKGQKEAATSLGLSRMQVLRLVVLPQAMRVIVPPMTSQMLNLTKNSSLAVAIGYPDLVNVANTSMNQTGQAVECIALILVIYLSFSLLTSAFMNWYNHATRLVGR
ncbi:MAG: ABC transporter permease subunit [Pseudomonadota bacterium]|nr:ABC transporter permease subunit [Pseudomonadota bacterium]